MARASKPYEDLEGGAGRAVHFRPERHRARDLLFDYPLRIEVDGRTGVVEDIAMNGLAFQIGNHDQHFRVGTEHDVRLSIGQQLAFSGRGCVARPPESRSGDQQLVALKLMHSFIDIDGLVEQHESITFAERLDGGAARETEKVPADYRAAVGEVAHFFQYYRRLLDQQESHLAARGGSGAAIDALVAQCIEALRGPYREVRTQAAEVAMRYLEANPTYKKRDRTMTAMKRYTESLVTPLVADVPILHRAYTKPLGYPGDFDQMMSIYRDAPEGDSVFAKVFHKLSIEEPLAAGVRTRKDVIKDLHRREHARVLDTRGPHDTFRVTSVACGPAKEVEEYIQERHAWPGRIQWTLVDQEERALSRACDGAYRALAAAAGEADIHCLYSSFRRMVSEPELFAEQGQRDFIYAAGLFDYLRPLLAQRLIKKLMGTIAPGGLLAIGNARVDPHHFWSPEMMLDWSLLYRSETDMLQLASSVEDVQDLDVIREPSGGYLFLLLRKKA